MVPVDDLEPMARFWVGVFETGMAWVAESEGRVAGFCARSDDNIDGLYIAPDARSHGIGKALLDLAKADREWITVWAYEKNDRAPAFYRREGLVEISREMETYDDGSSLMDVEHRWTRAT